jgi:activator of HSP90 ATPase
MGWIYFGKYLKLERGKRIIQEWKTTEWPDYPPSIVEFSFMKRGDGTELTMVHSKVPAGQAESYKQGGIHEPDTDGYYSGGGGVSLGESIQD